MRSSVVIEQVVQSQTPSAAHQVERIQSRRGSRRYNVSIGSSGSSGSSRTGSLCRANCVDKLLLRYRNRYMPSRRVCPKAFVEPCMFLDPFESDAVLWIIHQDL